MVRSLTKSAWSVAHASVIGASHLANGSECQDRLACRTFKTKADGEILIASVADGAGSTTEGQRGAELACTLFADEITDFLKTKNTSIKSLTTDFGRRWIAYFQQKISLTAGAEGKDRREFASTFVGAVIGETCAAFFQLGDGGIVVSDSGGGGSYRFAVAPADSVYVNMTDFLTDETAAERLRFEIVEASFEDVILFSDGIFSVAVNYQTNQPHEPFLMPMIAPLRKAGQLEGLNEKLENFLGSQKINEKTDDDKTIILASRSGRNANFVSAVSQNTQNAN